MATTTVEDLAKELKRTPAALLEQLQAAGINKTAAEDKLTEKDKTKLLEHLQVAHGSDTAARKKITLTKRETTEIRQADSAGKTRTVQVEVRKKRVLVKRDESAKDEPAS
jgi:translation initiation factor IF-2